MSAPPGCAASPEAGNKASSSTTRRCRRRCAYDADNRLATKTAGANGSAPSTTTYAYDIAPASGSCQTVSGASYCTTTKDANGGTTVDYYDARGRQIEETRPGGQSTQFSYDPAGNKITKIDASGRTTSYAYDADNRLTGISYSDGTTPNVTYGYNADSDRITMTDGTGTTSYSHDAEGNRVSATPSWGPLTKGSYDQAGRLIAVRQSIPAPTITSVSPSSGPTAGGTNVVKGQRIQRDDLGLIWRERGYQHHRSLGRAAHGDRTSRNGGNI